MKFLKRIPIWLLSIQHLKAAVLWRYFVSMKQRGNILTWGRTRFTARALLMEVQRSMIQAIKLIKASALAVRAAGVSVLHSVSAKRFPVKLTAAVVCTAATASVFVQ